MADGERVGFALRELVKRLRQEAEWLLEMSAMSPPPSEQMAELIARMQGRPRVAWQILATGEDVPLPVRMLATGFVLGVTSMQHGLIREVLYDPDTGREEWA